MVPRAGSGTKRKRLVSGASSVTWAIFMYWRSGCRRFARWFTGFSWGMAAVEAASILAARSAAMAWKDSAVFSS